jgi:hypothetical protein
MPKTKAIRRSRVNTKNEAISSTFRGPDSDLIVSVIVATVAVIICVGLALTCWRRTVPRTQGGYVSQIRKQFGVDLDLERQLVQLQDILLEQTSTLYIYVCTYMLFM